jgi:hypothetical protein
LLYQYTAGFLGFNFYQKEEVNAINRFLVWYMPDLEILAADVEQLLHLYLKSFLS